nr:hypothetical protein CFP56_32830 [Quercus suber]
MWVVVGSLDRVETQAVRAPGRAGECNAPNSKESNPACQIQVKRRTDDHDPQIIITFVNGVEEVYDAISTPAQTTRTMILNKGQFLETEQMFRDAGEAWPVLIPKKELR